MNAIDYNEINTGYRNLVVYLVIILIAFAILMFYLMHLYITGTPSSFNMTNESWNYMTNSSTLNITKILTPVKLDISNVGGI